MYSSHDSLGILRSRSPLIAAPNTAPFADPVCLLIKSSASSTSICRVPLSNSCMRWASKYGSEYHSIGRPEGADVFIPVAEELMGGAGAGAGVGSTCCAGSSDLMRINLFWGSRRRCRRSGRRVVADADADSTSFRAVWMLMFVCGCG